MCRFAIKQPMSEMEGGKEGGWNISSKCVSDVGPNVLFWLFSSPPFSGIDQMMTYNLILKGIEKMDFPRKITRRPEDLIRRLCR